MHTRDEPDPLVATPHRAPKVDTPSAASVARSAEAPGSDARSMLELQRLAGNASVSRLVAREAAPEVEQGDAPGDRSPVLDIVGRGGGEPLAPDLRSEMEGRLGADFGSVRVHRDAVASESARAVDANAYTVGNDVVFRSDRWDPASSQGRQTLAHELSHVVQQASGPVDGSPAPGGIRVSSPDDAFERAADRTAAAALAVPNPDASATAGAGTSSAVMSAGPATQLEAAGPAPTDELEEDELSAGADVQREAGVQREGDEDELDEDETLERPAAQRQGDEDELEEEIPG